VNHKCSRHRGTNGPGVPSRRTCRRGEGRPGGYSQSNQIVQPIVSNCLVNIEKAWNIQPEVDLIRSALKHHPPTPKYRGKADVYTCSTVRLHYAKE